MKALYLLFLLLLFVGGCAGRPDEDALRGGDAHWPLFRGDAGLRGYSPVELPKEPVLRWTYTSNARTASSPVVYGQTAYWCDKRGQIYGVGLDGKRCFAYDFATAVEATPMIADSVLYLGRIDGYMSALSLSAGDTLWNFETLGQISASPNLAVFEGRPALVFGSYDNYLYCIDLSSGREIRRFESGYYINGAVAITDHYIFSGGCDAWLRVIDGKSGQACDSLLADTYIPASPAIDGEDCYLADHSGNVYALKVRNGKILRSGKVVTAGDDSGSFVSVPALSPTTLYLLADDRYLYAIDRGSGALRWRYLQKGPSGESSPVVCADKVLSCSRGGIVSLLEARSGQLLWEYDTGEPITACPAVIRGYFYILTTKGTLFCFGDAP
ncbi:MAG: PQQ-binding-like beta-propeller repeat protein [Tannerellaceae bacterium]|jgi:outer membrane protein assembly factor BamB|nr:PQQ-binding-like beta-propeller repeat protein [Tannerellaceae bacterium]